MTSWIDRASLIARKMSSPTDVLAKYRSDSVRRWATSRDRRVWI